MALDWLRSVIRAEFASTPGLKRWSRTGDSKAPDEGSGAGPVAGGGWRAECLTPQDPFNVAALYARGEVENASWYREWYRRWRGLQLSGNFHRYLERLDHARSTDQVYRLLTEHAVQMVGGFTCLLFPPQEEHPLRPLPNPALRVDAGRLTLSIALPQPGRIAREDVLGRRSGPLAGLTPLFAEERAVSLIHAPFGTGGVILLIERRQERVFGSDDWELLRLLSVHAAAALTRLAPGMQIEALKHLHPCTGLPGESRLTPILEHGLAVARRGERLSLAKICLAGLDRVAREDGDEAADRVRRTAAGVLRDMVGALGLVVHPADDWFLLVLPRLDPVLAEGMVTRLARQLPPRICVDSAVVAHRGGDATVADLLARLDAALHPSTEAVPEPCGEQDCGGEPARPALPMP
jgi:GGDEF domain-containing protein